MAYEFSHGKNAVEKLAEALGLGGKPILGLKIEAHVKTAVKVTVEFFAEVEGIEGVSSVFKEYILVSGDTTVAEAKQSWRDKKPQL